MSDTSPLFTKTSNVLRDITIVELQKNNDLLRNYIANKGDSPLYKYKVTIEAHHREMGSEWFPESEGIILSMEGVFATIAGWLLINQTLDLNKFLGCIAIFSGVIIVQLLPIIKKTNDR